MKKVIITGATGAIGTALIEKLIKEKIEILVILRNNSKRNNNIPNNKLIKKIYYDLNEYKNIKNELNESYDVFYHFAWNGTYGEKRDDMYVQSENIKNTLDAVELAYKFNCKKFIGAGSQAEYGLSKTKLSANTKTKPFTGYGMAKLCAGEMSRKHANKLGIEHIWTRILSVYGPNDGENSMIMSLLKNISNKKETNLTKGEQIWDYIYSKDVAEIFYRLGLKGKNNKTYIIGSGKTKTIKEYVEIIRKKINKNAIVNYGTVEYSKNQVMYLCANNKELLKDIDYELEYNFEKGCDELIKWYNSK